MGVLDYIKYRVCRILGLQENSNGLEKLPNTLYKYYKYTDDFNVNRLLGEIYFCSPNRFNDVFDAQHEVINNIDDFNNLSIPIERLKEIGYPNSKEIVDLLKGKESEKYKMEVRKKQIENVGMICLTNTPLSILMWAYYTENNGYCIEYDVNVIRNNIEKLVQQELDKKGMSKSKSRIQAGAVSYHNTLPCAPLFFNKNKKDQPFSKYFCKAKCWEHENEYRIVLSLLPNVPLKFNGAVKSITFGYNISPENVQSLLALIADLEDNNIEIYFLKKMKGSDGFEREKFPFTERTELQNLKDKILSYQKL